MSTSTNRSTLVALFSVLLAIISVCAAVYQNYIQTKYVDAVQRNVTRNEYIRACRDVIETYFQVKLKVGLIAAAAARGEMAGATGSMFEIEAVNAVARFGGIGTYLANFQDEDIRFRYTQLTRELTRIVTTARSAPAGNADALFAEADRLFAQMNEECVKTARAAPL
jgi:HEPN domain-containing protein